MYFGQKVRELRISRGLTQQVVADHLSVSVSYISKVKNGKLHFGDYPTAKFIHKLADELNAGEDELLLPADTVPPAIRKRIRQRPNLFRLIAKMDNGALDQLESSLGTVN